MGLIALISGFDYLKINRFLFAGSEIVEKTLYQGFTPGWYKDIGQIVCYQIFMSSFIVNGKELFWFFRATFKRCCDRSCRLHLSRDKDDEDGDEPNTKKKLQEQLDELYRGREF